MDSDTQERSDEATGLRFGSGLGHASLNSRLLLLPCQVYEEVGSKLSELRDWVTDESPGGGMVFVKRLVSMGIEDPSDVDEMATGMLFSLVTTLGLSYVVADWPNEGEPDRSPFGEGEAVETVPYIAWRHFFCSSARTLCSPEMCIPAHDNDRLEVGEIVSVHPPRFRHLMNRLAAVDGERHLRAYVSLLNLRTVLRRCLAMSVDVDLCIFTALEAVLAGSQANLFLKLGERG